MWYHTDRGTHSSTQVILKFGNYYLLILVPTVRTYKNFVANNIMPTISDAKTCPKRKNTTNDKQKKKERRPATIFPSFSTKY